MPSTEFETAAKEVGIFKRLNLIVQVNELTKRPSDDELLQVPVPQSFLLTAISSTDCN